MFLVGILSWWYGDGWRKRAGIIGRRIARTNDYFSVGLLLTTLFAPFRQISAGSVDGSMSVQLRAFFDKLISRIIGAIVRTFMILFGLVLMVLQIILGAVVLSIWVFVPIFPVFGLLLFVIGWVPLWH
ncbi:hypothetical protein BH10PAT4_BH10PAT4_3210 [soil metagenome]